MRIESVSAHAFGPLAGETLHLAPGLTVIVGANESAKSSWHAAIYAGLCGRKRGRGAATIVDREFAARHKPWDGSAWSAAVVLALDDGRRIELSQDLAGKVESRATDIVLARDVSNEIMFEGTPDGSRWLGLDRYSFLATACINQAALLEVLSSADELQECLARAAASATADVTAARALELLDDFQKAHVGRVIASSIRPLKKAVDALEVARASRELANREHEEYLVLVLESEAARQEAQAWSDRLDDAQARLAAVEAYVAATRVSVTATAHADRLQARLAETDRSLDGEGRRLQRILELDAASGGQAPAGSAAADEVFAAVAAALAAWKSAPQASPLSGESAESLRAQLATLPDAPVGDTRPDPLVVRARADLATARVRLRDHEGRRPDGTRVVDGEELTAAMAATPALLRDLAGELASAAAMPAPDRDELARLAAAARAGRDRAQLTRAEAESAEGSADSRRQARPAGRLAFPVAAILAALGVVGIAAGQPVAGAIAVLLAAVAGGIGLASFRRTANGAVSAASAPGSWARASDADRVAIAAEEAHKAAVVAAGRAESVRSDVAARCAARGLPADADRLRQLAAEVELARSARADHDSWSAQEADYSRAVADADARLREALAARGEPDVSAVAADELADAYERACAARAEQAQAADRGPQLQQRIREREAAESLHQQNVLRRLAATESVVAACRLTGLTTDLDDGADDLAVTTAVARLEAWQGERSAQVDELDNARAHWQELQTLLDGASVDEIRAARAGAQAERDGLALAAAQARQAAADAEIDRMSRATVAGVDPGSAADLSRAESELAGVKSAVEDVRAALREAAAEADRTETRQVERAARLPSVAEAEEAVASAEAELDRVTELSLTLGETTRFLQQAQDRVHRSIAPVLVATLTQWLPTITDGRYVEAMVDPATLNVQVRAAGRPWRHADRLSVGTAEQIYLLLRVALAQHLAVTGETCPLLLDDVTVQADASRTIQILELLLAISADRQVVLFAQEQVVADWARERLSSDRDAVIHLSQVATA